MKMNLIAVAAALLFGGTMSNVAFAQSEGYYDRDGGYHAYRDADARDEDRASDERYGDERYGDERYGDDGDRNEQYGREDRDQDGRSDRYDQGGGYDAAHDRNHDGRDDRNGRWDGRRHMARHRFHGGRYAQPRNFRYSRYDIGSRLPSGYYGGSYYVDYRPYGLSAPPRGYRWNRVGNDVYLVSVNNGLIRDVMYSLFY